MSSSTIRAKSEGKDSGITDLIPATEGQIVSKEITEGHRVCGGPLAGNINFISVYRDSPFSVNQNFESILLCRMFLNVDMLASGLHSDSVTVIWLV